MDELKVDVPPIEKTNDNGMDELIQVDEVSEFPVSGRELHERLGISTPYHIWFPRMCEYGFEEGKDYCTKLYNRSDGKPGKPLTDHRMDISTAKEICMLQRTEQGRTVRRYLIQVEKAWNDPDMIVKRALQITNKQLQEVTNQMMHLEAKIEADAPKVLFADSVSSSQTEILVGELAKILKQNGMDIGQNRLFKQLREDGYLVSRKGTDYNMPTQKSMELGLMRIKETTVTHADGHVTISKTPKVLGKGQVYFVNKYARRHLH